MTASPATLAAARAALRLEASPGKATGMARFFKTGPGEYGEGDRFLGVPMPRLRTIARQFRDLPDSAACTLLKSPWHEERMLGAVLFVLKYRRANAADRAGLYRLFLANRSGLNNWDLVDATVPLVIGAHLLHQKDRSILYRFARSRNLWERRIAMLATFTFIRAGDFEDALKIAELLLNDHEDLIHKAAGWMLREVGNRDRAAEEAFLHRHARTMPRTMLRYAIEKFPEPLRKRYLAGLTSP